MRSSLVFPILARQRRRSSRTVQRGLASRKKLY
jgi:hypothetical protein